MARLAIFPVLIVLLTLSQAWPAHASVAELAVPVADRSTAARDEALRTALDQVVVKLAGERALTDFFARPADLLSSYQYRREFDGRQDVLTLHVRFDLAALRAALRNAGYSSWENNQPSVLFWVHAGQGWLDAVEVGRQLPQTITVAQDWGFSLRFPQLDMAERQRVYTSDIVAGSVGRWMQVSSAYALPWALSLQLQPAPPLEPRESDMNSSPDEREPMSPEPNRADEPEAIPEPRWYSIWTLADTRQIVAQFELPAMTLAEASEAAWRRMNGLILEGEEFRRASAPSQDWTIELENLENSRQYLQAVADFQALDIPIKVRKLTPRTVELAVHWKGTAADLRRTAIEWGWTELRPEPTPVPTNAYGAGLQSYGLEPPKTTHFRFSLGAQ